MTLPLERTLVLLIAVGVMAGTGCNRQQALSPEAARAKGDALLRDMSKNMAALQTFAYTVEERRQNPGQSGAKSERKVTRHVIVRRPNGIAFTGKGDRGDIAGWYDGKQITLVSHRHKVWARGPMPPTLDEALDFISAEYAIQMPTADLLYSSPYDAVMTPDTTGGWVDLQTIGDVRCDHLAYQQSVVDWEIWLGEGRRLPCRARIVYKNEPGQPTVTVTYSDLDLSPAVSDDTFAAKIPEGSRRIKVMRHATVADPAVEAVAAEPAATRPSK
jgi:hypothetical protein